MITVTLDTNVLASGFAGRYVAGSTPGELIRRWRDGQYEVAVSEHIIGELEKTLEQPYFALRVSQEERAAALAVLRTDARFVLITVSVSGVASHAEDDLVLATAMSAEAEYLVTGDGALQQLGSYSDITILSPRAFLDLLYAEETIHET